MHLLVALPGADERVKAVVLWCWLGHFHGGPPWLPPPLARSPSENTAFVIVLGQAGEFDDENVPNDHRARGLDVFHPGALRSQASIRQSAGPGTGDAQRLHLPEHDRLDGQRSLYSFAPEQSRERAPRGN